MMLPRAGFCNAVLCVGVTTCRRSGDSCGFVYVFSLKVFLQLDWQCGKSPLEIVQNSLYTCTDNAIVIIRIAKSQTR